MDGRVITWNLSVAGGACFPRFPPGAVYGSGCMSKWTEGVLALVVVLAFGLAMQVFAGDSPGGSQPNTPGAPSGGGDSAELDPAAVARGQEVVESVGCLLCHNVDGSRTSAPTFKGLYGSQRPLETGEFVTADDAYLRTSILDPASQVVQGYPANLMPDNFGDTLTAEQIDDIIAYIKSLSS
jgi:mono/diheme cytochrome c family protein